MYFPYEYIGKLGGIKTDNPATNTKCYEPGDEPLDTVSTKFSPRAYFTDYYSEKDKPLVEKGSSPFMAVLLDIRRLPLPNGEHRKELYETFDRGQASQLPDEYEFEVFIRERPLSYIGKTHPEKIYVSKILRTPKGNPVVFMCPMQYRMFKNCETRLVIRNVSFDITKIDTGHIPVNEWTNFYKQMRTFLDDSIVKDDEHLKSITRHLTKQK